VRAQGAVEVGEGLEQEAQAVGAHPVAPQLEYTKAKYAGGSSYYSFKRLVPASRRFQRGYHRVKLHRPATRSGARNQGSSTKMGCTAAAPPHRAWSILLAASQGAV